MEFWFRLSLLCDEASVQSCPLSHTIDRVSVNRPTFQLSSIVASSKLDEM